MLGMEEKTAQDSKRALFVNCQDYAFHRLKFLLKDKGTKAEISQVSLDEFEGMLRDNTFGGYEIIMFHLDFGEHYCEDDIYLTERYLSYIREECPHIRLGIMSGAYDYDSLGNKFEGDFLMHFLTGKINHINGVVLLLKPDFYCSYTDLDETFEPFMAEQIAKGWLREEEITWREAGRLNILTPRAEFGPHGRIERE